NHSLRCAPASQETMAEIERLIDGGIIESAKVLQGSRAAGKTIGELDFRARTGATILTVLQGETPLSNPPDSTRLETGNRVVLYGPHAAITAALAMFDPPDDVPHRRASTA